MGFDNSVSLVPLVFVDIGIIRIFGLYWKSFVIFGMVEFSVIGDCRLEFETWCVQIAVFGSYYSEKGRSYFTYNGFIDISPNNYWATMHFLVKSY